MCWVLIVGSLTRAGADGLTIVTLAFPDPYTNNIDSSSFTQLNVRCIRAAAPV
jgi:hypothetical protein